MVPFSTFIAESDLLRKYAQSDNFRAFKYEIEDQFDHLKRKHPFTGGTVYRGLNFKTPKQYLEFRRSIKSGFIESRTISSWGRTVETGSSFAMSPQVFQVTASVLDMYDPLERINGFVGVVISTDVPANVGIEIDYAEDEVILPPGRYKIKEMIVEKKWKHLVSKIDINAEVLDILAKNQELDLARLRALFRYKGGDLFDEVKMRIIEQAANIKPKQVYAGVKSDDNKYRLYGDREINASKLLFPDGTYHFSFNMFTGLMEFLKEEDVKRLITHEQLSKIRATIINVVNASTKAIAKKKVEVIYRGNAMNYLATYFDLSINDFKYLKEIYASMYARFNEELRKWNKERHFDVPAATKMLGDAMNSPFKGY